LSDATIRVLIFQKSSTLTNEINENLSLLGDGCSLFT
jgi:succinyl-CoA synthetase alpha subunit